MEFLTHDFRHAREILDNRDSWGELQLATHSITRDDILQCHQSIVAAGGDPAGGQRAINRVFRERLEPMGWKTEPRLFAQSDQGLRKWKMDFLKARIGIEIAFNHSQAIPWIFTRLNIAGESEKVMPEHQIDVGVAIFAAESLKRWARMDDAVGTFEWANAWLEMMRPIMPIPILVMGLSAESWPETDAFRGTRSQRTATTKPALVPLTTD